MTLLHTLARIDAARNLPHVILRSAAATALHVELLQQPDSASAIGAWGELHRLLRECAIGLLDSADRALELSQLAADAADRGRRMHLRIQQNRPRARQWFAPRVIDATCTEASS